ncbi:cache domain-containing protein [Devosia albogilva]|uniref:Cache domain-containing protein n=1 Tax=Devosia albogilva TaxID=429726 RepID=A0ABW5QFJ8_9HYPH
MKLRSLLSLVLALVLCAGLAALTWLFQSGLRSYSVSTSEQAVHVRTEALGTFLSRSLFEEWQRVERAAERVSGEFEPALAEATIVGLEPNIDKFSWIGIADRSGTVLAASGGMLEGENVAQRPWFQQGLAGPFAGDVHEAVLLAKLLESNNDDPIRFVDFSAPIRDERGQVAGVLGAHVNWEWVEQLATEAAGRLQLDAFILNRAGTIILQTDPSVSDVSGLRSFRAASLGVETTENEVWPDGETYFATTLPQFSYQSLPSFGWSMVARLDPTYVQGAETTFRTQMLTMAAAVFLLMLVAFGVIAAILLRPLRSLAENFLQLARGEPTPYVREHRRFAEATILSDAIALLQSRLGAQGRSSANSSSNETPQ